MNIEKIIQRLSQVTGGQTHEYYDRVKKKASFYKKIVTGKDQAELIVQYRERETDAQKEQRIKLTNTKTKSASGAIMATLDKIRQADEQVVYKIAYTDARDDQDNTEANELLKAMSNYYGGSTVKKYLDQFYNKTVTCDSNAWLVNAYTQDDDGDEQLHPIIYPSHMVVDWKVKNGVEVYCTVKEKRTVKNQTVNSYTVFTKGYILVAIQYLEALKDSGIYPADKEFQDIGKEYRLYTYELEDPNLMPATRFGYIRDIETNGETFVSILDIAEYEFKDLISTKSEYDITRILHTFLQKMQVAEPCTFSQPYEAMGGTIEKCQGGRLNLSKDVCPGCGGSGLKFHTTPQSVMLVKQEDEESEKTYIPLSERIYYPSMPFEIVEHQYKLTRQLPKDISVAIFSVDISEKQNPNVTATAIQNFYDAIYNVLADYADQFSYLYKFIVKTSAMYLGVADNLVVTHKYPRDFKLVSAPELAILLKQLQESNAGYEVIKATKRDLMRKIAKDDPMMLKKAEIQDKFRPFRSLSQTERQIELATLPVDDVNRVLYIYFDFIMDAILADEKGFEEMPYAMQKDIITKAAEEYAEKIKPVDNVGMREAIKEDGEDDEDGIVTV